MDMLKVLKNRLEKIGIIITIKGNLPWIYLESVNGNIVKEEDYNSNHGYTIAWYPIRNDEEIKLDSDIKRTFKIIRKYGKNNSGISL
jgi:hypothetical protein